MSKSLDSWLEILEDRQEKVECRSFDAVRALAVKLGVVRPAKIQIIVGGTNGKGSVSVALERILISLGYSVGVTLSPHLTHYNQRFRINGHDADDASIVWAFESIDRELQATQLTYFDYATLAGLLLFKRAEVQVAVVEVGLGGALDCANVIEPDAVCITNVSLDHMKQLGATREAIASEKAGILRDNLPFVYGESCVPSTLRDRAQARNCESYWFGRQFGVLDRGGVYANRGGARISYEITQGSANLSAAAQVALSLNIPVRVENLHKAARYSLPARMEEITVDHRTWILDIAHNPGAIKYVLAELEKRTSLDRVVCVFACLADKQVGKLLAALIPLVKYVVVTDSLGARGLSAAYVKRTTGDSENVAFESDLREAMRTADGIADRQDWVLVCGSVDVVSRARQQLVSS